MNKSWLRKLLGGISLGSVTFVFQACYGTPHDLEADICIEGTVVSSETKQPIQGIKVNISKDQQYSYTDDKGYYCLYILPRNKLSIQFLDVDSVNNGLFQPLDTVIQLDKERILLDIELSPK